MYGYMYTYLCVYRLCCAESGCVVDISPAHSCFLRGTDDIM